MTSGATGSDCQAMMRGGTIIAMAYGDKDRGGVVLAADSQCSEVVTVGSRVVGKRVLSEEYVKILKLGEKIYTCVSGNVDYFERVYHCVQNVIRIWERTYGCSCSVREIAGVISFELAQDKDTKEDVAFIVGGWDEVSGPQIYHVKGGGVSENLKYQFEGSGSVFLSHEMFDNVVNSGCSKEETKHHVLNVLNKAVIRDCYTGGQIYTVVIDKTDVVKEVLSQSGEVIPDWGWM